MDELNDSLDPEAVNLEELIVPLPSRSYYPSSKQVLPLSPLLVNEQHMARVLGQLLQRAGLSVNGAARLLHVNEEAVRQYTSGRRGTPGLIWFARFVDLCGGKLLIELPDKADKR